MQGNTTNQTGDSSSEVFLCDISVAGRYEISKPTVWRWARDGRLPKPIKLSPGCSRWKLSDLIAAEAEKAAKK